VVEGRPDGDPGDAADVHEAGGMPQASDSGDVPAPRQVHLRRAPRYRAFVLTGVVLGILIAAVLNRFAVSDPTFSGRSAFGYLAVVLGMTGGVLGGATALLVERRHR
jgi:hypothetical protein